MLFARRPRVTRPVVSQWLIAVAVATAGLLIERQPPHLIDPVSCPGLLEWTAIVASRAASRLPLAAFLASLNAAGVFLSLLALTRWIQRAAVAPLATAAVSVAAAFTIVTTPVLASSNVLAIGAACAAWIASESAAATHTFSRLIVAWVGLALTAAIAPPAAVPLAAAAAWLTWHISDRSRVGIRLGRVGLAAMLVLAWPLAVVAGIPALPGQETSHALSSCVLPETFSLQNLRESVAHAFAGTGPVPLALASLAAFTLRNRMMRWDVWPFVAIALLPVASLAWSNVEPARALAPTIAAAWWLAAAGYREVIAALTGRTAWRAGAWLLTVLLPVLQWSHRSDLPIAAGDVPRGHEQLTRRDMLQFLSAFPSGSTIVIDDAVTDSLLRAAAETARQRGKAFNVIPRHGRAAVRAAAGGPVYAMPRAQFDLQHQGLTRVDDTDAGIRGIVAFERAADCVVLDTEWRETTTLAAASRLAVISSRADARGPVVVYLGSPVALSPHPLDWPAWSLRGYLATTYDMRREGDRQRLAQDGFEDRHPRDARVFGYPHLTRLELWRVPDGPMILPLGLNEQPEVALARGSTATDGSSLDLCPSFPVEIGRLEPRTVR